MVLVEDADIGPLLLSPETDFVLHRHAVDGVSEVIPQNLDVELANDLFGCDPDGFGAYQAGDIGRRVFAGLFHGDPGFEGLDLFGFELAELVGAVAEQFGKADGHSILGCEGLDFIMPAPLESISEAPPRGFFA